MANKMVKYLSIILCVILCLCCAITDYKSKKIYNKVLIFFFLLSLFLNIFIFLQTEKYQFYNFLINFTITLITSYLFYYFKIWSAGDAKLFSLMIFMIPFDMYNSNSKNVFPAFFLLINIFSVAFLYLIGESIYLSIFKKVNFINRNVKITTKDIFSYFTNYLVGYSIIYFINTAIISLFNNFNTNNTYLHLLLNILLLYFIYSVIKTNRQKKIILLILVPVNIAISIYLNSALSTPNILNIFLVLGVMFLRNICEKYNYEYISVNNLAPRMILSFNTIAMFYGSNVKKLPHSTTEDTDSRITEEEVKSIKRWSKTKKGQEKIEIVRHLPFAPFMLVGLILFIIIKMR